MTNSRRRKDRKEYRRCYEAALNGRLPGGVHAYAYRHKVGAGAKGYEDGQIERERRRMGRLEEAVA